MFDYNYELDTKSMDIVLQSAIPLRFLQDDKFLYIGNIDLASLDQNEEADKWLFIVQPWMKKREVFLGERLHSFDCSHW
jgi:pyrimidine-specific ribonucleoside hydrolase